jgi:hypothetical protein
MIMDNQNSSNWRNMFEAKRRERPPGTDQISGNTNGASGGAPFGGYDDGFDAAHARTTGGMSQPPLTPEDMTDEAAMALGGDTKEYTPWVLQRSRTRPVMMLHLRRFETRSGLWCGWEIAYPHLIAVEYTGDKMLSLDFGTRQFMLRGHGLDELVARLQQGTVLMVQEYCDRVWPMRPAGGFVTSIAKLGNEGSA